MPTIFTGGAALKGVRIRNQGGTVFGSSICPTYPARDTYMKGHPLGISNPCKYTYTDSPSQSLVNQVSATFGACLETYLNRPKTGCFCAAERSPPSASRSNQNPTCHVYMKCRFFDVPNPCKHVYTDCPSQSLVNTISATFGACLETYLNRPHFRYFSLPENTPPSASKNGRFDPPVTVNQNDKNTSVNRS